MAPKPDSGGIVSPVKLRWYAASCGECREIVTPTPDEQHARDVAATHEHEMTVEPVELEWYVARHDCGWEGNPTKRERDAKAQLAEHLANDPLHNPEQAEVDA